MFTEIILRPPAWKIKMLIMAGAVCAACLLYLFATGGRYAELSIPLGLVIWVCWDYAYTLANASLGIRKFGIEIKRRAAEPLFIEWKEIERIETAVFHALYVSGRNNTSHIGIRLADKCPGRHTKTREKNRLHSGCDILLAGIYGMSIEKTVAWLNEKMCEATGAPPPARPAETTKSAPNEAPAKSSDTMHMGRPIGIMSQPCIETKCPMCLDERIFFLLEANLGASEDRFVNGLVCNKCCYEVPAGNETERAKLLEAAAIWETAESKDAARAQILALKSEVITRIIADSETINCPKCGEITPAHFSECWKCQHIFKDLPPAEPCDDPEWQ